MTDIDKAQLAALDASGAHNVRRYEYGEFDTVKAEQGCNWVADYGVVPTLWHCTTCDKSAWRDVKPDECSKAPLIAERETTHGDFSINADVSQRIKDAVRGHAEYSNLSAVQREALDHMAGKIGRIVAGDADFADHWRDIAGYAELVLERIGGKK